jgi:hypothetical protein
MALRAGVFGPSDGPFDPIAKLGLGGQPADILAGLGRDRAQYAVLVTNQPVHVQLLSDTPLGAWMPTSLSTLDITPRLSLFASSDNSVELSESYRTMVRKESEPPGDMLEVPTLDVLGKGTILWIDDPNGWVRMNGRTTAASGEHTIVGLVLDPPFAARISIVPTTEEAVGRYLQSEADELLPEPLDTLTVADKGSASASVVRAMADLPAFDEMAKRITENNHLDSVVIDEPKEGGIGATGKDLFSYEQTAIRFRYPPVPPSRGLNVFGGFSYLRFDGAVGSVVVGSRILAFGAPSVLEFKQLSQFRASRGVVPVQTGMDGSGARLDFSAVSDTFLNDEPVTPNADGDLRWVAYGALFAGIIQAVAACIGLVKDLVVSHVEVPKEATRPPS